MIKPKDGLSFLVMLVVILMLFHFDYGVAGVIASLVTVMMACSVIAPEDTSCSFGCCDQEENEGN